MSKYGYIKHSDGELAHHGILGQKWGVRRYQNADGSLTPEGMRRYGYMQKQSTDSSVTKRVKDDWYNLSNDKFRGKYQVSKDEYSRRVKKYGDPYKNSPMAQWAKKQNAKEAAKKDVRNMDDFKLKLLSTGRSVGRKSENSDSVVNKFRYSDDYRYLRKAQYNDKKAQEIARKYIMDYAGAKLKDIGMKDSAEARKYLASKSYFQESVPYVKDYVARVPGLVTPTSEQTNKEKRAEAYRRAQSGLKNARNNWNYY